jgi:hypothetical protein
MYGQCNTNILGFGRYLQDVDPERRPVLWQIERTIVFCLKHFERDIERAVGKGSRHPDSPFGQCFDLISVQTCGEYDTLCDELQGKNWNAFQ